MNTNSASSIMGSNLKASKLLVHCDRSRDWSWCFFVTFVRYGTSESLNLIVICVFFWFLARYSGWKGMFSEDLLNNPSVKGKHKTFACLLGEKQTLFVAKSVLQN